MASAVFTIEDSAALLKYEANLGDDVAFVLVSTDGVSSVTWVIESTDEQAGTWTIDDTSSISGSFVSVPASGPGRAAILRCDVNGGSANAANGGDTQRAKIWIGPNEVCAVGETTQSDPSYGWAAILNPIFRGELQTLTAFTSVVTPLVESDADLVLGAATSSTIQFNVNDVSVGFVDTSSNVSRFRGTGSTATEFSATTGPVRLRGNNIETYDGTDLCTTTSYNTGSSTTTLLCNGHGTFSSGGNTIVSGPTLLEVRSNAQYYRSTDGNTEYMHVSANGVAFGGISEADQGGALRLPAIADGSVGTPSAGHIFLWYSSTSSALKFKNSGGTTFTVTAV